MTKKKENEKRKKVAINKKEKEIETGQQKNEQGQITLSYLEAKNWEPCSNVKHVLWVPSTQVSLHNS